MTEKKIDTSSAAKALYDGDSLVSSKKIIRGSSAFLEFDAIITYRSLPSSIYRFRRSECFPHASKNRSYYV